jgi:hypothetical protein
MSVKPVTALAANKLGKFLAKDFRRIFGPAHDDVAERLGSLARSTIECLGRSDALYHNYEHTLQVTMVGREGDIGPAFVVIGVGNRTGGKGTRESRDREPIYCAAITRRAGWGRDKFTSRRRRPG